MNARAGVTARPLGGEKDLGLHDPPGRLTAFFRSRQLVRPVRAADPPRSQRRGVSDSIATTALDTLPRQQEP